MLVDRPIHKGRNMAGKPVRTREATRAAIITAAERVFAEKGFAGASMSAIAAEARVTKSLIHYHFTSKQALWQEIKETQFEEFAVEQSGILGNTGGAREFVGASMKAYFSFLHDNPHFLRLMWWTQAETGRSQHPDRDFEVGQTTGSLVRAGIEKVQELQDRGELRADLEPRFMFAAFLSLLRHWFVARGDFPLAEAGENEADIDQKYLDTITAVFLDGVLPRT
jgi:TetR/AcrR family transcriptional regulator